MFGTIIAANGTITTLEEATVYVKDVDLLITVQVLEDSPGALSQETNTEGLVKTRIWIIRQC